MRISLAFLIIFWRKLKILVAIWQDVFPYLFIILFRESYFLFSSKGLIIDYIATLIDINSFSKKKMILKIEWAFF